MKLVETMLPKKNKESNAQIVCESDEYRSKYPYGLEIRIEDDLIEKMPMLKELSASDIVNIMGVGCVTGVNYSEKANGKKRYCVTIQIEQIGVEPKIEKSVKEMNMKEYKSYRESGKK